ncbi:MAG TPA: MogA/MoaB family molybdenum cofactor biosynthesis protein [Pyrinomonadaceae bacterium]|nr:MogA/MoaB family molybdenum cofactor biosynthesis protein [Acidobacteriota bacterium]HQZ96631.1 MogA/MoaB family molybdenum cofactor biosynthesis protein [Pyrinomonadaceae bacterium]
MKEKFIKVAIITVSDTRKLENDMSGNRLAELLTAEGAAIVEKLIITDDLGDLTQTLHSLAQRDDINLIITTGGTGFAPRDNTPEATRAVIEREAPGLAEAMRRETALKTPTAMLSRGVCGIRGNTLIINLPGSPKGVEECFEVIRLVLGHAIAQIAGDTAH